VVQKQFLGERRALAERDPLQHGIFLAGPVDSGATDIKGLGVQLDDRLAWYG
jgi:hypothetical protein